MPTHEPYCAWCNARHPATRECAKRWKAENEPPWRPIETAPVASRVEAKTARGAIITGRTTGRGPRGRRGANTVEDAAGYRHVCTHWRLSSPAQTQDKEAQGDAQ